MMRCILSVHRQLQWPRTHVSTPRPVLWVVTSWLRQKVLNPTAWHKSTKTLFLHSMWGLPKGASNIMYRFTNANNVRIWVGGWISGNQVKKKCVHPEILHLLMISLKFIFLINYFLMHCGEIVICLYRVSKEINRDNKCSKLYVFFFVVNDWI